MIKQTGIIDNMLESYSNKVESPPPRTKDWAE